MQTTSLSNKNNSLELQVIIQLGVSCDEIAWLI